jgi:hypothetical protein
MGALDLALAPPPGAGPRPRGLNALPETRDIVALDIETTGLDPRTDRIISVAVYPSEREAEVFLGGNEAGIICRLQEWLGARPPSVIVGWGSSRFDCPVLRQRADGLGLALDLHLGPVAGPEGGGGWPVGADGTRFGLHPHLDLSCRWRQWANASGLSAALKSLARTFGIPVIEVDRARMSKLSPAQLAAYNLSDVRATHQLALMLGDLAALAGSGPAGSTTREGLGLEDFTRSGPAAGPPPFSPHRSAPPDPAPWRRLPGAEGGAPATLGLPPPA